MKLKRLQAYMAGLIAFLIGLPLTERVLGQELGGGVVIDWSDVSPGIS